MQLHPTLPHHYYICAYIEFVAKDTPSPRTIANNLSHIRTYLRKAGADTTQLDHQRVKWAMVAVSRNKEYIPRIKLAFPVEDLHRMVAALTLDPQGNIIRTSVLLMFYAALRQSEVLAPSVATFDHRKHLTRGDILLSPTSVTVKIKHAKNMQSVYQSKTLNLQQSSNPLLCIVTALQDLITITPTLHQHDPCIMSPATRRPVTVDFVRRRWTQHLQRMGMSTDALSLHSVRKAAATTAHDSGCSELDIQRYGGWRSNAHRQYIATSQQQVNTVITRALSNTPQHELS